MYKFMSLVLFYISWYILNFFIEGCFIVFSIILIIIMFKVVIKVYLYNILGKMVLLIYLVNFDFYVVKIFYKLMFGFVLCFFK